MRSTVLFGALMLCGCGSAEEPGASGHAAEVAASAADGAGAPAPAPAPAKPDAWVGRWVGPEGLFVDIRADDRPGEYELTLRADLDSEDDHDARLDGDVLRFERNGEQQALRRVSGDETGLKWLAGKKDCLMIRPGEGFCRD